MRMSLLTSYSVALSVNLYILEGHTSRWSQPQGQCTHFAETHIHNTHTTSSTIQGHTPAVASRGTFLEGMEAAGAHLQGGIYYLHGTRDAE